MRTCDPEYMRYRSDEINYVYGYICTHTHTHTNSCMYLRLQIKCKQIPCNPLTYFVILIIVRSNINVHLRKKTFIKKKEASRPNLKHPQKPWPGMSWTSQNWWCLLRVSPLGRSSWRGSSPSSLSAGSCPSVTKVGQNFMLQLQLQD